MAAAKAGALPSLPEARSSFIVTGAAPTKLPLAAMGIIVERPGGDSGEDAEPNANEVR